MVKRLRVDSNRDSKYFLRNVNLMDEPASPEMGKRREQEEFTEFIRQKSASMSKEERKELERTKELLTIVQAGADLTLVESAEDRQARVSASAEEFLCGIYDAVIESNSEESLRNRSTDDDEQKSATSSLDLPMEVLDVVQERVERVLSAVYFDAMEMRTETEILKSHFT